MHRGITDPKDYLIVEDKTIHSTWHLPISHNGVLNRRLMGNAHAALHKNFRGNPYMGPKKGLAIKKLKAAYKKLGIPYPK